MKPLNGIKKEFPIFKHDPQLVYLDSTATSLKPQSVVESLDAYYQQYSANIYRGVYKISEHATAMYESTRTTAAQFINARSVDEIIFTRNTTESLNLIAYAYGRLVIGKNDEIVTTIMEHHSNFVPWQRLALENGADLKIIDVDENGLLTLDLLDRIITKKTKIVALTYISNVLGTVNPIKQIIKRIRQVNPKTVIVVDGAQAAPHRKVDVRDLDCDFFAFSSHKMLGPTGVGILWGRYELLDAMVPFIFGGEMIQEVKLDHTAFKKPPQKFEAGTPHIAGVIAFKAALDFLSEVGMDQVDKHEKALTVYAWRLLHEQFGKSINIIGPSPEDHAGILAFTFANIHAHDVAQILDEQHVCIRAGHHCAMPLHAKFHLDATARASFYIYNTERDVDALVEGLEVVKKTFL